MVRYYCLQCESYHTPASKNFKSHIHLRPLNFVEGMGGEIIYRNYPMSFDKEISERNAWKNVEKKGLVKSYNVGGMTFYGMTKKR